MHFAVKSTVGGKMEKYMFILKIESQPMFAACVLGVWGEKAGKKRATGNYRTLSALYFYDGFAVILVEKCEQANCGYKSRAAVGVGTACYKRLQFVPCIVLLKMHGAYCQINVHSSWLRDNL